MKNIKFSSPAIRFLKKADPLMKKRLQNKIDAIMDGSVVGNFLHNPYQNHQKVRVGNCRIVYTIKDQTIYITAIQHRSKVYKT